MNPDSPVDSVGATNRKPTQFSGIGSRQIHGKQTHNFSKLGFGDFRTVEAPVFPNHLKKLAYIKHVFAY